MKINYQAFIIVFLLFTFISPIVKGQEGVTILTQILDRYPKWSADGSSIYFYSNRLGNNDLFRIDVRNASLELILEGEKDDVLPISSPDNKHILFVRNEGNEDIWLMNLSTKNIQKLTNHEAQDTDPSWSPDGKTIYFISNRSGNYDVWSMNIEGKDLKQITTSEEREAMPSLSPDGKTLLFQRTVSRRDAEIFTKNIETGKDENLSNWSEGWDGWPTWHPNGNKILFSSNRGGSSQLWQVDIHSKDIEQVTNLPGLRVRRSQWSPDGSMLVTNADPNGVNSSLIVVLQKQALLLEN